ncbi:MAG TPA: hypothetical protein VHQ87_16360 [Rhizobacter sp.]|nr:hypothetical protein [Rhizobacter sp.]
MHCIDTKALARLAGARWLAVGGVVAIALAGCGSDPSVQPTTSAGAKASPSKLTPPSSTKNWTDFKLQAAKRMMEANPDGVYHGPPQQVLLAIPVLEIELNADGSIKRIEVMRRPGQAPETLQMAIDAVKRAAPFGDVSKLPKPWKFTEVFLFNDDKRFKPRTLDTL